MNEFKLAEIFGDSMILQRDEDIKIWGNANDDKNIKAVFLNTEYVATVNEGRFEILIPAQSAGTDYEITIKSDNKEITLKDICFGDVFYLAGQSNMELPVSRTLDKCAKEVEESNYPLIRQYRLTPQYRLDPQKMASLPNEKWVKAVPGDIMELSALGFFASKNIQGEINVPIGLIMAAQGGASVEAWMNEEDNLRYDPELKKMIDRFTPDNSVQDYLANASQIENNWREALETGKDEELSVKIPEESKTVHQPEMIDGLLGCVWLYKEIDITELNDQNGFLYISNMIDVDRTYVNGILVGRTEYRYPPRKYTFDKSILKEGSNLIAIRLLVQHGKGGIVPEHDFYFEQGDNRIELEGEWKLYEETKAEKEAAESLMGQTIPTALFQSSIVPVKDMKFKAMWWYQGETNANRPQNYLMQFKDMVTTWRKLVGYDFPVILVQMPDYIDPINGEDKNWDLIQEAQIKTPEVLPNSMTAIGKDLGEAQELHPQRKSELGKRFAECVMKLVYNK